MGKVKVLVEVEKRLDSAFDRQMMALGSEVEALDQGEALVEDLAGFGLDVQADYPPVPMFGEQSIRKVEAERAAFSLSTRAADMPSESTVVACEVDRSKLEELATKPDITVWPNSELVLVACRHCGGSAEDPRAHPFDLARTAGGLDCRPFRPAVTIAVIRRLLGVQAIWRDGFRGQNIVVGIIDEGVNGEVYPVIGGFSRSNIRLPGTADISSHGSMCAADVLVAAPAAKLYDYPFLGVPDSGGALTMFQEVLNRRRIDGTPHLTNNSYGFVGRPSRAESPRHEVWDLKHPVHRKVREVVASGCPAFFAAGNCGAECPSGNCMASGIGPGSSIHASNSLAEVITVAAVNSRNDRIGYSSQGPGGFQRRKPDVSSYAHFFGNFGPGRPAGGTSSSFDNGTSAATPVAAGVGALLMSAIPNLTPALLKTALIQGAINIGPVGWDADTGFGVINAAASYAFLRRNPPPVPAGLPAEPLLELIPVDIPEPEDGDVEPPGGPPPEVVPYPRPKTSRKGKKKS